MSICGDAADASGVAPSRVPVLRAVAWRVLGLEASCVDSLLDTTVRLCIRSSTVRQCTVFSTSFQHSAALSSSALAQSGATTDGKSSKKSLFYYVTRLVQCSNNTAAGVGHSSLQCLLAATGSFSITDTYITLPKFGSVSLIKLALGPSARALAARLGLQPLLQTSPVQARGERGGGRGGDLPDELRL